MKLSGLPRRCAPRNDCLFGSGSSGLGIARGSLAELETQIMLAQRLNYLTAEKVDPALEKAEEIGKMLKGLQKSIATN